MNFLGLIKLRPANDLCCISFPVISIISQEYIYIYIVSGSDDFQFVGKPSTPDMTVTSEYCPTFKDSFPLIHFSVITLIHYRTRNHSPLAAFHLCLMIFYIEFFLAYSRFQTRRWTTNM